MPRDTVPTLPVSSETWYALILSSRALWYIVSIVLLRYVVGIASLELVGQNLSVEF